MNEPRRPFDLVAWLRRGRRPLVVGGVALLAVVAGSALGLVLGQRNGTAGPSAPIAASTASPSASEAASPSPSATASPTATETSSPSPTLQPTATPTAVPTAVPTPTPTPGGGAIAFHSGEDIWTINADGTDLRNLTKTAAIQEENAAWSADGALIAFQSWADGGGVEVMNADGTGRRRVADGFARNAGYFTDSIAWAPNGHRLAIASVPGDISIIDVSSGDRIGVGHGDRWLAWSPSGRYLTWAAGATIEAYDSTARSSFTIAAMMSSNVRFLNWFPKEDRLLFVGFNDAGSTDLYTVNFDGSGLTAISLPGGEDGAQLSADGTRVLFSRAYPWPDTAKDDVALLQLGDATATPVLRVPGLGIARWAPDDARAVAEREGRIFLLQLGSGGAVQIANGYAPVWRPLP